MINTAPAVIVGADLNGLGVVRSLARAAVPTMVVDTTRWHAAMWSRFAKGVVVNGLDGRSFVESLLKVQRWSSGRPVLILTDDAAVSIVSEHRDELTQAYRFQLPPRNILATLSNKARFFEFAAGKGIPVPRSIFLRADTPTEKLAELPLPVIIKPTAGPTTIPSGKDFRHPIYTLKDAEVLSRRLLEFTDEVIVQEWIGGPDSNVCFAQFHRGRDPDSFKIFIGRKIACHPSGVGGTALCLPAPEVADNLEPMVTAFLDLTNFAGLGSIEFKWDPRQRRYAIIGLTVGRTDRHAELSSLSGVNIPLAAYRYELGMQPINQKALDRNVAWRDSAFLGMKLPLLPPSMTIYDGYWRRNDPLPAVFLYSHAAIDWMYRRILKPAIALAKRAHMPDIVKPILRKGKASAR